MAVISGGRLDQPQVRAFPILSSDGRIRTWLSQRVKLKREDFREGIVHSFVAGDDLDALAGVHYNDGRLWWIIADVNNLPRRYRGIPTDTKLWIPLLRELRRQGVKIG